MSERPFMQLYVSDFIGDTLHLSTEQIGAYMLLLMAMWNAGGKLPADDAKLARVVRMSVKRWRGAATDLMGFFDVQSNTITHPRLTKELQKSESKSHLRASAGSIGGTAKALKDKEARVANASALPQHLPDTITRETSSLRSDDGARKRATRLPDGWTLPDDWRADAVEIGLPPQQIDFEADSMRDWSKSSADGARKDWRAMWRNWCRRVLRQRPQARGSPQLQPPSLSEVFAVAARTPHHDDQPEPPADRSSFRQAIPHLSAVRTG